MGQLAIGTKLYVNQNFINWKDQDTGTGFYYKINQKLEIINSKKNGYVIGSNSVVPKFCPHSIAATMLHPVAVVAVDPFSIEEIKNYPIANRRGNS